MVSEHQSKEKIEAMNTDAETECQRGGATFNTEAPGKL